MTQKLWMVMIFITILHSKSLENEVKVNFSGVDRDLTSINWNGTNINFTSVSISDFDLGYLQLNDLVVISELSSNSKIKITATHNGWSTLPSGYTGNKTSTTGDVQIFVDNLTGGLTAYSGSNYGTAYTEITNSGSNHIIESGNSESGATGDINARILLDWAKDISGNYNLSLEFTVTNY
jgi:hypothetical protein